MWDLPGRGLADGLHPDASFSKVLILISHDRYIHRIDWRLSHLDWEGWGVGKKQTNKQKKKLLHEIIPRFGLPRSLQSDNGTSFTSKITQGVSKALSIAYYFHCAWRPQSSGKVKKSQPIIKISNIKITQETSLGWKEALPIALFHTCIAPKGQVGLSPYEMLYGRPFVYVNDLFPRSRGSDSPVLYHGHWTIPTGYMLVGYEPGPKRF